MTNMIPKILAPAGGKAQFLAALNSGADAVFLGLKEFNARARAENFSYNDLKELVPLAKQHEMQVLVTTNILIKEGELKAIYSSLDQLVELGIDAVIVQDLGLAKLVKEEFPELRLHASTQLAVHNLDGVKIAFDFGFKRVVLARELTFHEMKKIGDFAKEIGVELEAFCHGSLCYSYSGLCFFSGSEDARSGNRGECAYTCRKPYKVLSEPGHGFLFSMKDLDSSKHIHSFVESKIHTLKIEGRKKDAQYVATSVALYRRALDTYFGTSTLRNTAPSYAKDLELKDIEELRHDENLSFHRETTTFFLQGRYEQNVIDLNSSSHKGVFLGNISFVDISSIELILEQPLECYDGVRIETTAPLYHSLPQHGKEVVTSQKKLQIRYQNEEIQFGVRKIYVNGKKVYKANIGDKIRLEFSSTKSPNIGDKAFLIRSNRLKREVEELVQGTKEKAPFYRKARGDICFKEIDNEVEMQFFIFYRNNLLINETIRFPLIPAKKDQKKEIEALFSIIGDASFEISTLKVEMEKNYFIPISKLKEFKRSCALKLDQAFEQFRLSRQIKVSSYPNYKENAPQYIVKIDRQEALEALIPFMETKLIQELIIEPKKAYLNSLNLNLLFLKLVELQDLYGICITIAIATVIRGWEEPWVRKMAKMAIDSGFRRFEVGNIGALNILSSFNMPLSISADFTLYSLNHLAVNALKGLNIERGTLSVEDDKTNMGDLLLNLEDKAFFKAIIYKDIPLFIAESCSLTALHGGCPTSKVCGYRSLHIENGEKERFIVAHELCKSIVYGEKAYAIADRIDQLQKIGIYQFQIDFLVRSYSKEEISTILQLCLNKSSISLTHRANFDRILA